MEHSNLFVITSNRGTALLTYFELSVDKCSNFFKNSRLFWCLFGKCLIAEKPYKTLPGYTLSAASRQSIASANAAVLST